ncbi:MAG: hypothetical protein QXD43_00600 [Candidatus Aenigmatarchaeota archaeon]
MKATIWNNGSLGWGIRVGNKNREKYFSKNQDIIIINFDGINYGFELKPSFWRKCCEIRGKAIKNWVEKHGLKSKDKINLDVIKSYKIFKASLI